MNFYYFIYFIIFKISSEIKISNQQILLFSHTTKFLGFKEAKRTLETSPLQPINVANLCIPEEEKRAIHMGTGMHSCSCGCTIWVCLKTYMSHFAYACKVRYPLNLVLESLEYLWFYSTFCIVILDYGLKLHKLSNHTLVMLQK